MNRPANALMLWECDDPDYVEPEWFTTPGGKVYGMVRCEICQGVHTIDPDRMRTWEMDFDGLAQALARTIGATGPLVRDVQGRVSMLGTIRKGPLTREVFLARGIHWLDDGKAVFDAPRLGASPNAVILFPAHLPPVERRRPNWYAALALEELLSIREGNLVIEKARLFEDQRLPSSTTHVLSQEQVDILEALAEKPNDPMLVAQLVAASGYGRDTVMKAIKRLADFGLIARPGNSARKGVAITEAGRKRVGILPKMA